MFSTTQRFFIAITFLVSTSFTIAAQTVTTIAGNGATGFLSGSYAGDGGQATAALLYYPADLAYDGTGNLYIADSRNSRIRKIDAAGIITTFAGSGTAGYSGDGGPATAAEMTFPESIVFDAAGNLYVADRGAPSIRKITPAGIITTVVGNGTFGFAGDGGPATAALLDNPSNVRIDATGNLYICDWINGRVRKVDAAGIITTIAGNGTYAFTGDGGPATAAGMRPSAILIDPAGDILVCDIVNSRLRKINSAGIITTFAGTGTVGYSGDGGPATAAEFRYPSSMVIDPSGNLLVSDKNSHVIRKIDAAGIITSLAGTGGTPGFSGDGGLASAALFQFPTVIAFNPTGQLVVADMQNNRVRKIDLPGTTGIKNVILATDIQVFPNPATEELHIYGLTTPAGYTLNDVSGKPVISGSLLPSVNVLSLKSLAPGIYVLHLTGTAISNSQITVIME